MRKQDVIISRPYTHKELKSMYKVSWMTFQKWVRRNEKEIGKKEGHFYSIKQVGIIFDIYGVPDQFLTD